MTTSPQPYLDQQELPVGDYIVVYSTVRRWEPRDRRHRPFSHFADSCLFLADKQFLHFVDLGCLSSSEQKRLHTYLSSCCWCLTVSEEKRPSHIRYNMTSLLWCANTRHLGTGGYWWIKQQARNRCFFSHHPTHQIKRCTKHPSPRKILCSLWSHYIGSNNIVLQHTPWANAKQILKTLFHKFKSLTTTR